MVDGWISCNQCGHRHGSFMSSCPKCGYLHSSNNNSSASSFSYASKQNTSKKRGRTTTRGIAVRKDLLIIIAISVVAGIISALVILNLYLPFILHSGTDIINNSLRISNDISSSSGGQISQRLPSAEQQPKYNDINLKLFALDQINQDRKKNHLPSVELSENQAAQMHAQDVLKTRQISHWMTNGQKPYMTYTQYGGMGAVEQNVATAGFDDSTYSQCTFGIIRCQKIDPQKEIEKGEYGMMYQDKECCNDGHRDNILDKYHSAVSIGIAYDEYYFVMVQNFENGNYINFTKPILAADNKHIQLTGILTGTASNNNNNNNNTSLSSYKFDGIAVYYDENPTNAVYLQNKNKTSYSMGRQVATVVGPMWMGLYRSPGNGISVIYSDNWFVTDKAIDINFDISPAVANNKEGVYTIVVFFKDANGNGNSFPVTDYSVHYINNYNAENRISSG